MKLRFRRPVRLTFAGKLFVGVTVGVGLAAVNTGNNLLYLVLGLLLSLLLFSGVMSEVALRRIRAARRLPERAFAGVTTLIEISLRNEKRWLPSYSIEVEDRAERAQTERRCYFLKIGPQANQAAAYRRTCDRRGRFRLLGYRVSTRYPFGLIEKSRIVDDVEDLIVFPKLIPVRPMDQLALLGNADAPTGAPGPGTEVGGLREYRRGDEARLIHWRRTASLGRLVLRETERDAMLRVTLVLDNARPWSADSHWDDAFEAAVSETASLAASAIACNAAVDVVARGARSAVVLPGMAPDPIWRFLALLETLPEAEAPPLDSEHRRGFHIPVRVLQRKSA